MKIYCNRRNDATILTRLRKFSGEDLWFKVVVVDGPSPFAVWHKIYDINDLNIIEFSEVLDSDSYSLSELENDMNIHFREGYYNYIDQYRIHNPLEVYTSDDLKEMIAELPG